MTAAAIIRRVRDAGGAISLAKDRLKLSLPKSVADALTVEIRASKDAIRRALKYEAGDPGPGATTECWQTWYGECAAIREFDAHYPR